VTACNLCSAAPRVGWSQTVLRPGTAGRENSHSDFLTDTAQKHWLGKQGDPRPGELCLRQPLRTTVSRAERRCLQVEQEGARAQVGPVPVTPSPARSRHFLPRTGRPKGLRGRKPASSGQTVVYLVLRLLQVPTRPEGESKAVADFGLIFSASQLLCQPQS